MFTSLQRDQSAVIRVNFSIRAGGDEIKMVTASVLLLLALTRTRGCVDLVADCGAAGDGVTDDTGAFGVCQAAASAARARSGGGGGGCVVVPPRHYRVLHVVLGTSHIAWHIRPGATFSPRAGMRKADSLFYVGAANDSDTSLVRNISISAVPAPGLGEGQGRFTVDISRPQLAPWNVRAFIFLGGLTNFSLANVNIKLADPAVDPGTLIAGSKSALEFNTLRHGGGGGGVAGSLNPRFGTISNVTSTGGTFGYGTVQVQSLADSTFENIDGTGGVTLRLETGVGYPGAYVGGITARNITCRDGHAALVLEPHNQANGRVSAANIASFSCSVGVELNGGYVNKQRAPGLPAGYFANDSAVLGVLAVYGKRAQADANVSGWPACTPCGTENAPLNYEVAVSGMRAVGFPPPQQRFLTCQYWKRWEPNHCFYNASATAP